VKKNAGFSNRFFCIAANEEQWFRLVVSLAIGGIIISMITLLCLYLFSPKTLLEIGFAQKIFDKNFFDFCIFFTFSSILGGIITVLLGTLGYFFFWVGAYTISSLLDGSAKQFIKLFFDWFFEPMTLRRKLKKEIKELTN
jgi:hypothetical protein